jgi:hypothetical protein
MASFLANLGEVFRHAWLEILDSERALNEAEEGHITAMAIVFLCKSGHHRSVSFAHFFWAMVKRTKILSGSLRDEVIMDRPRHGGICNWRQCEMCSWEEEPARRQVKGILDDAQQIWNKTLAELRISFVL